MAKFIEIEKMVVFTENDLCDAGERFGLAPVNRFGYIWLAEKIMAECGKNTTKKDFFFDEDRTCVIVRFAV
jgi:hypothetical protein